MTRSHALLAVLFAVVVPGASWLDGSGALAWTMFASSETFRVRITTIDPAGRRAPFNPTALAPLAIPSAALALAGSDHVRHAPFARPLRASLPELTQLVCAQGGAAQVEITIESRPTLDSALQSTTDRRSCDHDQRRARAMPDLEHSSAEEKEHEPPT